MTANVAFYAFMPAYDITGLTNDVEYTVRVIATNAGGDGPPSQEQTVTPGTKSDDLWQYIEDEIVEEHEDSHEWLRQTLNYLRNNNIPLIVWTDASDPDTVETSSDDTSELDPEYVESLNFPVSIVDGPEATKKETILTELAYIYTMTNGISSSPAPLGIAHVYFSESFLNLVSTNGACWESRLYLDVVVSLVLNDSLAGASDWNRCMARSEDATALAVVRSALSGQTPAWFAGTYNDSEGNPDLEQFWGDVQLVNSKVVAYQLRNSFGGYCDSGPDWGLRISRSLNRSLASAGFDTLVNPWRDGGCVPSAPISLTANLEGDGAASVSWEAPESNGGSLLSGYRIQWQSVDVEEGSTPQTKHVYFDDYSDEARPTEVSETIEGLTDGVEYTVRVLAHNPNGDGTAAEVTVPEPNAAPTGVPEISGTPQVDQTLHVAAPDPEAYVTVVITNSDDTVSWSDPDECTSDYNTYLKVTSGPGSGTKTRTHIGSVASGSTEATQTITYSWTSDSSRPSGVELELYCGTFDASSRQNVLIASTYLATRYRALREGTYSSAPLTALSISSGTLSPAFDRGINGYTAEVPNDIEVITLDPTVLTGYQTDFVRNPGWGVVQGCGRGCNYSYGNGTTTGIVLADADDETSGFQINLNRGENRLGIGVNKGNMNAGPGRLYVLTVTVENSPATGQPTINGTAQVGQTLTVDTSGISDADGLDNVTYSYQWLSSRDTEIDGATSSTYTFQPSDNGKLIKVRVTFTDDAGYDESLTSEATVAVAATVPTEPLSLTVATGDQDQQLEASWQAPSSNGGSAVTGYKVQWKESTDSWDTQADVSEATVTGTSHTITSLTGGVEYTVRVIASNVAGDGPPSTEARATPTDSPTSGEEGTETVESDSTAAWTATLTVGVSGSGSEAVWGYSWFRDGMGTLDERTYNEGDQTIEVMAILLSNGFVAFNVRPHPSVDFVLTVDGTQFASADASEVKSFTMISYVWPTTLDWAEDDTVALSLTLKDTDSAEQSEPAENTPATGLPAISGTPQVEQTLTADTSDINDADGLSNVSYEYQWLAGGTDIDGATGSSYVPVEGDVGKTIKVRVTFSDDKSNEETLTSAATVAVAAALPGAPLHVRVSPHDANSLDVSWEAPSSDGGSAVTGYKVQRKEATGSWDTPADVSQETVTGNTHTITGLTEGVAYAVRVIATNDVGDGPASDEATGTPRETTPPELVTAVVDGAALTLTYNEALDENSVPAAEAFAVMVAGTATTVDAVSISGSAVALTLAQAAAAGDTVTVSYTAPADAAASRIRDLAGNAAPPLSGREATNNTAGTAEDEEFTTPNAPTGLSVSALNEGMRLSWTAPEDSTVAGYQILRQRPYECEPTLMIHVADTGTTATTFIDPDLDRNVRYTYRVKAINGDKIGSWSNFATSLYFAPKHVTQPNTPAAPHSLDSVSTHGGIELTWEPPNSADDIVGYRILRQRPEECEKSFRVHVENTGSTAATFVDEDVEVGTKYTYRVKAINAEGHGVWSGYTSTRRGLVEVIMMSSQDHHSITKGTKTQFQVSASHLPRDNDPSTVDYILRGDVTETEGGANVDSCEDANLGTDISISVVDSVSVQYGGTFGGPGCTAGNYTVTYVVTEADTGNRLAGTVFPYEVKSSLDVGSLHPNNLAKGLPTISGTAQVGNELTAQTSGISDADGLDNVDYSYQWIGSNGNSDTDIEDATDSTYTPSPSDVGKTIKVKVSFTDDADNDETLTSEATVAVAATVPSAPQSLTVTSGSQTQELDASWQAPSSNGGSAVTGYKVQWKESTDSWDTAADVSEATETGTTHTITEPHRRRGVRRPGDRQQHGG